MKFLTSCLVFASTLLSPLAALSASDIYRIPNREEQRQYQFLRNGKMGVDIGFRAPLLLYGFAVNRMTSLKDSSTEVQGVFERTLKNEFYYFSQQLDEEKNYIVQKLEGYSIETYFPRQIYSETLYSGPMYGDASYYATFSEDQNILYTWKQYGSSIEALNLETKKREKLLELPDFQNKVISRFQRITFAGKEALAVVTDTGYAQGEVWIVEPKSKSVVLKISGYDLGRRDAKPGSEPYNIVPNIDSQGQRGVFCDHDACVVVELKTKKILFSYPLPGGNNSSAQFSADGRFLYSCDSVDQKFSVKNVKNGKLISSKQTEICSEGKTELLNDVHFLHNFSQVLSISKEGKILDSFETGDPVNAYDDVVFLSDLNDFGSVITVDWQGAVQKQQLKVK